MQEVDPEFDGEWFIRVGDRIVEAPSLAALKKKLGPEYLIRGYYPDGYSGAARPTLPEQLRSHVAEPLAREAKDLCESRYVPPPKVVPLPEPVRYARPVRVDAPVSLEQSTPAPKPRAEQLNLFQKRYDHEAILNLWAQGFTGPEIAEQLKMPNWKRIGDIISQARKRGDRRAQSRSSRTRGWA